MAGVLPPEIQTRMNEVAQLYAARLRDAIHSSISKFSVSNGLKASVTVKVIPANGDDPPVIEAWYEEYGEFIGKRKMLWTKLPPIDKIKEWVDRKGLTVVPGYSSAASNLPRHKQVERIAWAISLNKRKNDTFKRHPWKKEALPEVLRGLNKTVLEEFADAIANILAKSISNVKT